MIKRIIHLSDLHFGSETSSLVSALTDDIQQIRADIIVISGDLTQRALNNQFIAAKKFIDTLKPNTVLCVPGNHDISLHNLIERFSFPFAKYKKFISDDLNPAFCDENLSILGINSATPYKVKAGIITSDHLNTIKDFYFKQPAQNIKIAVMHHNLIRSLRHKIISNSENIINTFAECDINIILSGHLHHAHIERLKRDFFSHNMYAVTAGTATSHRTDRLRNSYNVIEIEDNYFKMSVRELIEGKFITTRENSYPL